MDTQNDLLNPRNFNRSDYQLEEFLIFAVFVAGKNSKTQSQKVRQFLNELNWPEKIFETLRSMSIIEINDLLKNIKSGQYNRLTKCLYTLSISGINLRTCTCEDLEKIPGIGMKTSRFFIVYSREDANYCIIDTHILKWFNENNIIAPKSTPTNKTQYLNLERKFLEKCKDLHKKPFELDFEIWVSKQTSWK